MRHNSGVARYTVNPDAVKHAKRLIDARRYVLRSRWQDVQPRAREQNAFLLPHVPAIHGLRIGARIMGGEARELGVTLRMGHDRTIAADLDLRLAPLPPHANLAAVPAVTAVFPRFFTHSPERVTLAGAAFGQTVLAKAAQVCGLEWDSSNAHSAKYDAERSADIFCEVCNALDDVWRRAEVRAQSLWSSEAGEAVSGGESRDNER